MDIGDGREWMTAIPGGTKHCFKCTTASMLKICKKFRRLTAVSDCSIMRLVIWSSEATRVSDSQFRV